jgi:hypothetical protein
VKIVSANGSMAMTRRLYGRAESSAENEALRRLGKENVVLGSCHRAARCQRHNGHRTRRSVAILRLMSSTAFTHAFTRLKTPCLTGK